MLPRSRSRTRVGSWNDFETRGERGQLRCKQDREKEPDAAEEKEKDVQHAEERWKMQNLTVQATGASDDGFQEFVLDPPSRNFFPLRARSQVLFFAYKHHHQGFNWKQYVSLITDSKLTCHSGRKIIVWQCFEISLVNGQFIEYIHMLPSKGIRIFLHFW